MALIDIEGGDHLQASLFTTKGWQQNPTAVQPGRVRGSAWQLNASTQMVKALPSSYSTIIVGFGVQWVVGLQPSSSFIIFRLLSGTSQIAAISSTNTGLLTVLNSAGTVIATGTTPLVGNTWYYLELKLVVGTSGSCELHLNGVSGEIASTTGNFGTSNVNQIAMQNLTVANAMQYDDLYLLDTTGSAPQNDFLGDVCVEALFPNGDGTHQAWTPSSAGAHFSKVNENTGTHPDGDTTYVSDVTPGDIDTYTVGPLATLTGTVYGVATNLYARKDDAAGRQIAPVIVESGTDHVGATTVGLTTSYLYYRQLYQTDPAGAAWTIASVNGCEYGVKEVS